MNEAEMKDMITRFLDAWNAQDPERVADCYTDDLLYTDPNTRGPIRDKGAFVRYLSKLFAAWEMTWATREPFLLDGGIGGAFLWHATFKKPGGDAVVEADGMDLVLVRDGRIARNEVYFDRAVLAPLSGG